MRILITGANGFVGEHLLAKIQKVFEQSAQVATWDVSPPRSPQANNSVSSDATNITKLNIDVTDAKQVTKEIIKFKPTHIIHLAAISHIPTSISYPQKTWNINVFGTLNLLEAVKHHCPQCTVIYVSSGEVYGTSFRELHGVNEAALLQPRNPYAASKAAADIMVGQYAEQGLHAVRLRPFNHTGDGQSEDFVVASFAAQIARIEKRLQPPVINVGNLDTQRDFLDVEDVVSAYIQVLKKSDALINGSILNISSGIPRRIADILHKLLGYSTTQIEVKQEASRMRAVDIPIAYGINAKALDTLKWQPTILWETTLTNVLNYWRNQY